MSWKKTVSISKEIYQAAGPAVFITRLFGLFPVAVQKNGTKYKLKFSPLYVFYSWAFGIIIIFLTYYGFIGDVLAEKEKSVRIKDTQDIYVMLVDISVVVMVVIVGIFGAPFKYTEFCKFVQCLKQADAVAPPTDFKLMRNLSVLMIFAVIGSTFTILTIDTLMYIKTVGDRTGKFLIFKSYTAFYVDYHIMMAKQYQFWYFAYCILRRLRSLNAQLNMDKLKSHQNFAINDIASIIAAKDNRVNSKPVYISKLIRVYSKLCDALYFLNQLFGVSCVVTLVGILWHLIESPYNLIVEVVGKRKSPQYATMMAAWCFIHLGRLSLIAQPCYACLREVDKTNNLVLKLLSSKDVSEQHKSQLQEFSLVLSHRKFEFSAAGLTNMDRTIITSVSIIKPYRLVATTLQNPILFLNYQIKIVGAITTYLVILLQNGIPE